MKAAARSSGCSRRDHVDIETDARRIYETFREDQKALDNQRRKQRLRVSCERVNRENKYVVWRGDTPIAQYDTLNEAVCRQKTEKHG